MDLSFIIIVLFLLAFIVAFGRLSRKPVAGIEAAPAVRLARIKKASFWVQVLMVVGLLMMGYTLLAFFLGLPFFSESHVRIAISHNHIYTSPQEMQSDGVLVAWLLKLGLAGVCCGVLFSLFGLYRRGILFATQNVRRIRALGYYLIVSWAIDYQLQSQLRDMDLSMSPVFIGMLIIFVSWIMDEGRKIQEEQELTV